MSPDGRKLAYMSMVSGYWQTNVVNADGTGQRHLSDDWYWNGLPVRSPDGKQIIFVSTRDENWPGNSVLSENARLRLWVIDADGSNQCVLNDFSFRLAGCRLACQNTSTGAGSKSDWSGCQSKN